MLCSSRRAFLLPWLPFLLFFRAYEVSAHTKEFVIAHCRVYLLGLLAP